MAFDRVDRPVQDRGDLLEGQVAVAAQGDHGAKVRRQAADQFGQEAAPRGRVRQFVGQRRRVGQTVGQGITAFGVIEIRKDRRPPAAQPVSGGVAGDDIQPDLETLAGAIPAEVLPDPDEDLLGEEPRPRTGRLSGGK
jgi:hypothetical protein